MNTANTTTSTTFTVAATAALTWALARLDWSVEVSESHITIYGRTGSGREGTFTFPLRRQFSPRLIRGGIDYANPQWRTWEEAALEQAAEARAAAMARLLVRYIAAPEGVAELEWCYGDVTDSTFGVETLAALGTDVRTVTLRRPLPAWKPEDAWDDVPSRAAAWAA